jgi:DNA-directed RNA polymerase subunit E'/Rpb7
MIFIINIDIKMNNDLFIPIKFTSSIFLKPHEVKNNIEEVFLEKIRNKYEGICTKHGYIKKNSIKIIKRSIGTIIKQHFNSNIQYNFQCIAEILNPVKGSIIKCIIKNKNAMGLLAQGFYENDNILEVIIPKISAGIISEINLDKLNINDEIYVEVFGKKFNIFDKSISIIGKAIDPSNKNIKTEHDVILEDDNDDNEQPIIYDEELIDEDNENEEDEDEDDDEDDDEEDEEEEEEDIIEDIDMEEEIEEIEEEPFEE